mmetsp:Transcript_18566/g.26179  ORF Transcript_18566/g.26179 Transcript_18566/m.26179 type:complete len:274 (+) Transcript_18566:44-865(+)|eukprot:CAMPEP_0171475878 /NCGR_PEP_ID=MMETSP0946-20130122/3254_1 /TAXON_ID=109269 /ORGANISM="Vaucheria litorea, Strain CCMP2940" /LENGTH=273 /DNA_ID=CAMNT_0012006027 /DNA_START=30 /DNA_END=851 /DNA_ORIENTATION=+
MSMLKFIFLCSILGMDGFAMVTKSNLSQDYKTMFPPITRPLQILDKVSRKNYVVHEQPHQLGDLYTHRIRHTIFKLKDGSVLLYNPIAPTEETLHETIQAFNKAPDHIIVPTNSYEHLSMLPGWVDKFPDAVFWGLPGVDLGKVKIRKNLIEENLPSNWLDELSFSVLNGSYLLKECFLLHKESKTIFTIDSFSIIGEQHIGNIMGKWIYEIAAGGLNKPSCGTKLLMIDKKQSRKAVLKALDWDFERAVTTHGVCPIDDAKNQFKRAFQFLI